VVHSERKIEAIVKCCSYPTLNSHNLLNHFLHSLIVQLFSLFISVRIRWCWFSSDFFFFFYFEFWFLLHLPTQPLCDLFFFLIHFLSFFLLDKSVILVLVTAIHYCNWKAIISFYFSLVSHNINIISPIFEIEINIADYIQFRIIYINCILFFILYIYCIFFPTASSIRSCITLTWY